MTDDVGSVPSTRHEDADAIGPHHFVPSFWTTSICIVCGVPERDHAQYEPKRE